ncbi:hypothetical protein DBZ36_00870 [Alginatibacterium sediminis]|uniref:FAD-binding FR-type domain-containing protein n=1 Tax=Alginatibacterium sediminis TaxID=2164068 RepID=A0A420ENC8_9ALTE|nr:ferric reductase-like transmembrane domain-containing protein [Alginatibacterium sediminis]RKF22229.1 hypothetical protein DBZ36_00870 [Alginatibacterium sediminis]
MSLVVKSLSAMQYFFSKFSAVIVGFWALCLMFQLPGEHSFLFWRHQITLLTGALALGYMAVCMLLAVRPGFLENFFQGLDRMYVQHKRFGIGALVAVILHWLAIKSVKVVFAFEWFARPERRGQRSSIEGINWHAVGNQLGEISMYLLIALVLVSLLQVINYKRFRWLHKISGVVFIIGAIHALLLMDQTFASIPLDAMLIVFTIIGSVCALISMSGRIGRSRQQPGQVSAIQSYGDTLKVTITPKTQSSKSPKAGQFYFVKFEDGEAAHPFTLSNFIQAKNEYEFSIKALGDYTAGLVKNLSVGAAVQIEGPYGRFQAPNEERQIWMGVGIGIAPFIAWLEANYRNEREMQKLKHSQIDLYYCPGTRDQAYFLERIEFLTKAFNNIQVHVLYSAQGQRVDAALLKKELAGEQYSLSYCGPNQRLKQLSKGLKENRILPEAIYSENFNLR